ncbi:MAG: hypothetical protein HYR60_11605 [Acidobacteria bacterium]|nr:hypothetical protein [Acidobacteriota bacterium]MBI3471002.1 hypothetical protein [Candidatus Solibacter usitatus]
MTSSTSEFVLLQLVLPGRPSANVGVVLLDPAAGQLHWKLRTDWEELAGEDDAEVLRELSSDFRDRIEEMGGEAFLRYLEDSFSNTLVLTGREKVEVSSYPQTLRRLFAEHVQALKVIPFRTHLPLYSLRAAATRFGEDMEVEAEDWVEAPEGLQLSEDLFVARVVGRSMEPVIPDGSLCIFRGNVVGSRQGKRLLVELEDTSASGGRYTVKRYSSVKRPAGEEQWEHARIRLEPLNREFPPMEFHPEDEHRKFRVIAEFVRVLE